MTDYPRTFPDFDSAFDWARAESKRTGQRLTIYVERQPLPPNIARRIWIWLRLRWVPGGMLTAAEFDLRSALARELAGEQQVISATVTPTAE